MYDRYRAEADALASHQRRQQDRRHVGQAVLGALAERADQISRREQKRDRKILETVKSQPDPRACASIPEMIISPRIARLAIATITQPNQIIIEYSTKLSGYSQVTADILITDWSCQ